MQEKNTAKDLFKIRELSSGKYSAIQKKRIYIISIAKTIKVVTNGSKSVSHGQLVAIAKISAAVEIKNNIQYKPFLFLLTSMEKILRKNRADDLK